jgi:membrane-associated protease RseP (regulator of RpoE activity)
VQLPIGDSQAKAGLRLFWLGAPLHGIVGDEFSAFGVSKDDAGVQLVKVPADSAAAKAGLREDDLIQGVNGRKVSNTDQLFAVLNTAGSTPLKLRLIRNQKPEEINLPATPFIGTETANDANGFTKLILSPSKDSIVTASEKVNNDPLDILTDGVLNAGYGPVFTNGIHLGIYKMDLGTAKSVSAISSWSFNQNENRGRQLVTIYGSNSPSDPGWSVKDARKFIPIGSIDTASLPSAPFTAASLRAPSGSSLGTFRWIAWETSSVTEPVANTAWQEFSVEVSR